MKPKESKCGESWIKVKNPAYSQIQDRDELFNGKKIAATNDRSDNVLR